MALRFGTDPLIQKMFAGTLTEAEWEELAGPVESYPCNGEMCGCGLNELCPQTECLRLPASAADGKYAPMPGNESLRGRAR
jgi:hypothetical protein